MSKTKQKTTEQPPNNDLVICVTLAEATPGIGQIVVKRGDLATVDQFGYDSLDGIMAAIQSAATYLIEIEANPPNVTAPKADPLKIAANQSTAEEDAEPVSEVLDPELEESDVKA